jgi:hypothetical protein
LKNRALAGTIDGFVYFGPPDRGTLVCAASGIILLSEASLLAAAHRGYDSSTLPRQCAWIRRTLYEARRSSTSTGHMAAWGLAAALYAAARRHGGDLSSITRADVAGALNDPQIRCTTAQHGDSFFASPSRGSWLKSIIGMNLDPTCPAALFRPRVPGTRAKTPS